MNTWGEDQRYQDKKLLYLTCMMIDLNGSFKTDSVLEKMKNDNLMKSFKYFDSSQERFP